MAYAAAYSAETLYIGGRRHLALVVTETGVTGNTHEWSHQGVKVGTLTFHKCVLTAGDGSATTIDPQVGEATGTASVYENGAAAALTRAAPDARYYAGTVYGKSMANGTTGTTGTIVTTMIFAEGHV